MIIGFLRSPRWKVPVMTFLDEKCVSFDNEEENKLEFTGIHNVSIYIQLTDKTGVQEDCGDVAWGADAWPRSDWLAICGRLREGSPESHSQKDSWLNNGCGQLPRFQTTHGKKEQRTEPASSCNWQIAAALAVIYPARTVLTKHSSCPWRYERGAKSSLRIRTAGRGRNDKTGNRREWEVGGIEKARTWLGGRDDSPSYRDE